MNKEIILNLANSRCKIKHYYIYSDDGHACSDCVKDIKVEYENKQKKMHGIVLNTEESVEMKKQLGL